MTRISTRRRPRCPGSGTPRSGAASPRRSASAPYLPKTVGTGCGVRRPFAMTSTAPEEITCLACRDWARAEYLLWAGMRRMPLRSSAEAEPTAAIAAKATPDDLRAEERAYRQLAARFEVTR